MSIRFALPFWQKGREPIVIRLRLLLSMVPIFVFLGLSRIWPPSAAILGGFLATAVVYLTTRRDRLIGALTTYGFVIIAISAAIGIAWSSEKAYLASGPVSDLLFVPMYLVSALVRKPLVGGISRELVPTIAGRLPLGHPLYVWLSLAWAVFYAAHCAALTWLLAELSVAQFVIWSRIVLWPPTTLGMVLTAALIYRAAARAADPGTLATARCPSTELP